MTFVEYNNRSWDEYQRMHHRLEIVEAAVREYVTGRSHMPYCGAAYDRGADCHCGLAKLTAAICCTNAN